MPLGLLAATQETPRSAPSTEGFGLVAIVQLVPSQCSISASPAPELPTATQRVGLTHETLCNSLRFQPRVGDAVTLQRGPRTTSVLVTPPLTYEPAAKQPSAGRHATPRSALDAAPEGLGLSTTDHVEPSHHSTNVFVTPPDVYEPTAWQPTAVHDTAFSAVAPVPAGIGAVTNDHCVPFQRSVNGLSTPPLVYEPDAQQFAGAVHDTPVRLLDDAPAGGGGITWAQLVPPYPAANGAVTPALS
jgi:hypothetical protein